MLDSGGKSKSKAPVPARSKSSAPARKPAAAAPAPAAKPDGGSGGGGLLSGLGGMVVQGMAFGGGSAIAHRAVDAVAGPRTVEHTHVDANGNSIDAPARAGAVSQYAADGAAADDVCGGETQQFRRCVADNQGNIAQCQFYYDVLTQCQKGAQENASW